LTVNVAGQLNQSADVLISLVTGGIEYGSEDRRILDLIAEVEDELLAIELRSTLDRIKDPATPPDERLTGAQRLKSFVYAAAKRVGSKVDEIGTDVLTAYLSNLVTRPPL
jgi:hypothetical protein